ncbi:hypothetical protein [Actinophytocola sediminis]
MMTDADDPVPTGELAATGTPHQVGSRVMRTVARSVPQQVITGPTGEELDLVAGLRQLTPIVDRHVAQVMGGMPYDWGPIADLLTAAAGEARRQELLRLDRQLGDIGDAGGR